MVTIHPLVLALFLAPGGDSVLLDFSSDRCGPCRMMEPIVRRLVDEGFPVRKINVDRDPQMASRFGVSGVPCFVMVRDGREVERVVGATSHSRLQQMFASAGFSANSSPPPLTTSGNARAPLTSKSLASVRGQSPTNDRSATVPPETVGERGGASVDPLPPSADPQRIRQQALHATVRLKIEDAKGHSMGTGTIVDVHGSEALVLTCGHIFRESGGKGRITVDMFVHKETRSVSGNLISYDLDRDIGLVSIVPSVAVEPVHIASGTSPVARGDAVFSVGCDRGGPPRMLNSQVAAIDKYIGPPNIEVIGEPADGRSGGGLFAADSGQLIGVCNMADPADKEGIYAALATIHWELDRIGLRDVYLNDQSALVANQRRQESILSTDAPTPLMPRTMPGSNPTAHTPVAIREAAPPATIHPVSAPASDETEVTCIIRRNGQQQMFVLDHPSSDLLHMLAQESRVADAPTEIALAPQSGDRSPAAWPRSRSNQPGAGENYRAQSADR